VVEVLEEAISPREDDGVVQENANSTAGTPEPLVTVAITSEKEVDWTIVSSTTRVNPIPSPNNTTDSPVVVRYFVKVTRTPWANSRKRTSLVNAAQLTTATAAPEISMSVEASTPEAERLPVPELGPTTTKAAAEEDDVAEDHFLAELIPTMKFFRLTTPSPTLAETSTLPRQTTSAPVAAATFTESSVTTKVVTAPSTESTLATSTFQQEPMTTEEVLPVPTMKFFLGPRLSVQSTPTAPTTITSEPLEHPETSATNLQPEQEMTESQELPFSSEVDDAQEPPTTPPTSESNDIFAQSFETQTARGLVVSSAVPQLSSLPQVRPLRGRGHFLTSHRALVPVVPSFVPMRLRELPETPQSIQDDVTHEPRTRRPETRLGLQEESPPTHVVQPPQTDSLRGSLPIPGSEVRQGLPAAPKSIQDNSKSSGSAHRFPLMMEQGANVNGLSVTPLATAAAVGQLSYTTTIPVEMKYTTRRPFQMKEVGPRKTAVGLVPETHLEKLQSELEIFDSTPVTNAPMQPPTPVDRPIFVLHKIMKYPIGKFGDRPIRNKKRKNRKWASFRITEKPHIHKQGHNLKKVGTSLAIRHVYGQVRGNSQQKSIEDEVEVIISPPKRKRQHLTGTRIQIHSK
ncbi:hypothetical protein ANCDUO_17550, partial [Ancylostoma duodenale]